MSFPLSAYIAAAISGFLVAFFSARLWGGWCEAAGHVDDPGRRKIHSEPVVLSGGLAVMTGIVLPLLAAAAWLWFANPSNPFPSAPPLAETPSALLGYGLGKRAVQLLAILVGGAAMLLLGWYDDRHELKPLPKLAGQTLVACLVAAAGVRVTLFVPNVLFSYGVTVLWILTIVNAMNFIDNMNGLCAGISVIAATFFAILAARAGQYLVASVAFLAAGSFAGFLPHNFPKARAFLGDAGSHLAGFLLAVLAVLPHFYWDARPRRLAVLAPLFVLAVPLMDIARVVLLRALEGKPFYVGDTNHISHWLVRKGLSRPRAVMLIWAVAIVLGAVTLLA